MNLKEIKKLLKEDEFANEKYECIQSVPPRFRDDAYDCLEYTPDLKTLDKAWSYFLDEIINEMTEEEMKEYHFG